MSSVTLPAPPEEDHATTRFVEWYLTSGPNTNGDTVDEILHYSPRELERNHDFIQHLFPLPEASRFQWNVPLLTPELVAAFRAPTARGYLLREQLARALLKIGDFWGFQITGHESMKPLEIVSVEDPLAASFEDGGYILKHPDQVRPWMRARFDHNHMRMTRVMRCLRVLGLGEQARRMFETQVELKEKLRARFSVEYWKRAVERGLEYTPDDEDGRPTGKKWLKGLGDQVDVYAGRDELTVRKEEIGQDQEVWEGFEKEDTGKKSDS